MATEAWRIDLAGYLFLFHSTTLKIRNLCAIFFYAEITNPPPPQIINFVNHANRGTWCHLPLNTSLFETLVMHVAIISHTEIWFAVCVGEVKIICGPGMKFLLRANAQSIRGKKEEDDELNNADIQRKHSWALISSKVLDPKFKSWSLY